MPFDFIRQKMRQTLRKARAKSLWYFLVHTGCCGDEVFETFGSRYDLERFGCVPQADPSQADLLIVSGALNDKAAREVKAIYDVMPHPKYVMAVGACACRGGAFREASSTQEGKPQKFRIHTLEEIIPVDVFVPGCPPRPESIMNGLLALQEKITYGYAQT